MVIEITTIRPRQAFQDNMRPTQLLLRVYRLLETDEGRMSGGELVSALRELIQVPAEEDLIVIYNEIFLGLVRERAQIPRSTLRRVTLCHMLRQAVVASCTALETYLLAVLHANMPVMIRARGRDFVPRNDPVVKNFFSSQTSSLDDMLRLLDDVPHGPAFIADQIVGFMQFKYLTKAKGVHVTGALLGIADPWSQIARHLNRDEQELRRTLNSTVNRRNDIVHRADRCQDDPGGDAQPITFAWTQQAVDTINHVCLALDELVTARVAELEAMIQA